MRQAGLLLSLLILLQKGPTLAQLGVFEEVANLPITANSILIHDALLFVAGDGLSIYDVEDPSDPIFLSVYSATEKVLGIDPTGGFLYLRNEIVNVQDPFNPSFASNYPNLVNVDVASGTVACAVVKSGTIQLIDLSDPYQPLITSHFKPERIPTFSPATCYHWVNLMDGNVELAVYRWTSLCVSSYGGSIHAVGVLGLLDTSDPGQPKLINSKRFRYDGEPTWRILRLVDINIILNQADGDGRIYEVPTLEEVLRTEEFTSASGDSSLFFARVYDRSKGHVTHLYDLTDPAAPRLIEDYAEVPEGKATVDGDFVYFHRGAGGLGIFRYYPINQGPPPTMVNPRSDIDESNTVDSEDLLILLADWKKSTRPSR